MTVQDLINELVKYDKNLPVCIDDYMGFCEINEETVKVQQKEMITFPYTNDDVIKYINLENMDPDKPLF